jgi:hypothetical protein
MTKVKYHKVVLLFLDELMDILIEKEYFSYYEYSAQYIEDLVLYIEKNIDLRQHKKAPCYFSKYGDELFYITYQRNKQTTWYILFQKAGQNFFVRHITNNHSAESQYFNVI